MVLSFTAQSQAKGSKATGEGSIADIVVTADEDTGEFGILRKLLEDTGLAAVLDAT